MHAGRFSVALTFLSVFLGLSGSLYAAGGTCPSGANYLSLNNPTGSKVALSSFGITSCYYVAANGSDSNNGTSESSPWLHAPGMPNCSATCASVKPAAGEGFIFRGGDTWHFGNRSASPFTGGGWEWFTWSGTSSNYIYIGVDPSWYSGSSWSRPILNADNPTSTSPVSSCTYQVAHNPIDSQGPTNWVVDLDWLQYVVFDDFEMTGMCWNTSGGGTYLFYSGNTAGESNVAYIENNYLHGWTHTSAGGQAGGTGIGDYSQNDGETIRFNVIDGSDSDPLSLQEWGQGSSGYDLEYNVTTSAGGTSIFQDCHIQHDNRFEYISQLTDNSSHSDVDFCVGEHTGSGSPNIFYNNIFSNIGSSSNPYAGYILAPRTPQSQTDYFFNNVFDDVWDNAGSNNNAMCDQPGAPGSLTCGPATMWNNTAESGVGSSGPTGIVWSAPVSLSVTSVNDDWITDAGTTPSAVSTTSYIKVTESNAVYQTLSAANGQGYTSANGFSPTSSSGATVTASGANETNGYCADSVLHNAAAETACKDGITGVSYNKTNHTVVYPAFSAVPRPATGAWQVGAYQLGGSNNTVNPPTGLTAMAH